MLGRTRTVGTLFCLLCTLLPFHLAGELPKKANDGTHGIEFLTTGASPLYQDWLGVSGNLGCSIDMASLDAPEALSALRMGLGAIASFAWKDAAKVEAYGAYAESAYQSILPLRGNLNLRLLGGLRLGVAQLSFTKSGVNLAESPSLYAAARIQADFDLVGLGGFRMGMWYAYEAFVGAIPVLTMPVGIIVTYAIPLRFSEAKPESDSFRIKPLVAEEKDASALAAQAAQDAAVLAAAKAAQEAAAVLAAAKAAQEEAAVLAAAKAAQEEAVLAAAKAAQEDAAVLAAAQAAQDAAVLAAAQAAQEEAAVLAAAKAAQEEAALAAAQAAQDAAALAAAQAAQDAAVLAAAALAAAQAADANAVAEELALVSLGFAMGDSAERVSKNIELLAAKSDNCVVAWASDKPTVIGNDGSFEPPDDDTPVSLTATVSKGSATESRSFPVLALRPQVIRGMDKVLDIANIAPGNGAIEVDLEKTIKVPFAKDLDPSTVNNDTVLVTHDGSPIKGKVGYQADSRTITFTPSAPYSQGTTYSMRMTTDIKDATGKAIPAGFSFDFTTLSYTDIAGQFKFNLNGVDSAGKNSDLQFFGTSFDKVKVHEGVASARFAGKQTWATSDMKFGDSLTVTVWVNMTAPLKNSLNTILANAVTSEKSNGFKLCINRWNTTDRSILLEVGNGKTGGKWQSKAGIILDGNWFHLAFVIDKPKRTMRVYFNGAGIPLSFVSDQGFKEADFNYDFRTSGPFFVGSFLDKGFGYAGNMDDFRVYNKVLSDAEIAKIAMEK